MAKLSQYQKNLFEALHKSRIEDFKTFNKKSYRGVWSSIIDKYPESAHFVYELLQNADDAEASEVYIILKKDSLLFKHNGTKHFDITREDAKRVGDINSITGIGDSSKTDAQNKIGKFGVGFKAVFQYTDIPEIYDDYFKFKIENYIIPTLLDSDHPSRKEGETLFVIPFKNKAKSFDEIFERLEKLQNPILFLRNLRKIVWEIENGKNKVVKGGEYSKELINSLEYDNDVLLEHLKLTETTKECQILLFSQNVCITDEDGNESDHLINVGFYYDAEKKRLITDSVQNIFCFFPTKETFKTCFVSHAPFLLTDNRQNLKPSEDLNKNLVVLLAQLAATAVLCLRDYRIDKDTLLIDENITEIIPNYVTNYWKSLDRLFESPIKEAFKELIANERIFLSRNGKYLSMNESFIGSPRELVDLVNQKQFSKLRKGQYEDEEMLNPRKIDFLKWELAQNISKQDNDLYEDIKQYSSEDFANDITIDFMAIQEIKWVTRMYTFLRTAAPKLWKLTDKDKSKSYNSLPFRKAPIIKTQKGEWVAPYIDNIIPNVYLPLKDDNKSEYNFVANEYLQNEIAKKFLLELDIKEPNEYDYIRQVILSKFSGEYIEIDNNDLLSDLDVLLAYYQKVKNTPLSSEYIQMIKNKIYLVGKDGYLHKPDVLYFYNRDLEAYFNGNSDIKFFDIDFYNVCVEKYGLEILKLFLREIGVSIYPKVLKKRKYSLWQMSEGLRTQILAHDYSEYYSDDYELEGFDLFSNDKEYDVNVSIYIWNELLPAIKFDNFEHQTLVYRRKYARTSELAKYISTFKDKLQQTNWLFDKEGRVLSAKNIALEDLSPKYNQNNGLIQFLGIEKREKTIIELGGTEEQQEQLDLGKRIKGTAPDLTDDEILEVLAEANARKKGKYAGASLDDNCVNSRSNSEKKTFNKKSISNTDEPPVYREELRDTNIVDMFVATDNSTQSVIVEVPNEINNIDIVNQKLKEQEEKHNKIKELREIVETSIKYSKEWFEALIELEYRGNADFDKIEYNKTLSISFSSVYREQGSDRIYIFKKPSRNIPLWVEEIGDIEVKCKFLNREELKLKFEVANVRYNTLRLKASNAYESILNKIDWHKCTNATISLKNQIDLMGKLRTAFCALELEDGFNLKENLSNNIEFIFGPPGTGKTTTLAKHIINKMANESSCRILVLTPTNTACDELAKKILEQSNYNCDWLFRFVSTADENLEDIVIDRESMAYTTDRCCIISTIARLSFDGFNGEGGYNRLTDIVWDEVICDEASMIPLAEIMLAVYNFTNTPIIIAGDPMQIKPILHEYEWKDENIYTMVKLDRFDNPKKEPIQFKIENLDIQYRSVPAIGNLFSEYSYDGKLKHFRNENMSLLNLGDLVLKPINFIPFKVEKFDSIFGIKKLDGSNVHIYSVLLTVEIIKYIVKKYPLTDDNDLTIGVVCPYSPQAQLIESLMEQILDIPHNIKITVGTVHRFQGGQCNLMFVVLNPPFGLKNAADKIFLNNKNILNVAISRAQDNLCILLPHRDTDGYENLYEINKIGSLASIDLDKVNKYTCDQIEEIIFGSKFYIESNAFVTSHHLANVYSEAVKRYEIRIDEKSVDIQLGT